jgi:hypothetical protein
LVGRGKNAAMTAFYQKNNGTLGKVTTPFAQFIPQKQVLAKQEGYLWPKVALY